MLGPTWSGADIGFNFLKEFLITFIFVEQILCIATVKTGALTELFGVVIGGFVLVAGTVGVSLNPAVTLGIMLSRTACFEFSSSIIMRQS